MSASQYELLKCDNCGKTLGHIRESVKIFPPRKWIRMWVGGPRIKVEKNVFCEECFLKRKVEVTKSK